MLKCASQLLYFILGTLFLKNDRMISVILEFHNLQCYSQGFPSIYISYPFGSMASCNLAIKRAFHCWPESVFQQISIKLFP